MKVAIFHGAGAPITIEDVADDPLGPGQVRIAVQRCGICGSDVAMTSGSPFDYAAGRRLGHESAGEVIELGRDVSGLKVGDRVAVLPAGFCGTCDTCRAGRPLFCPNAPPQMGGFGERMVITQRSAFRLPASVSVAEGALVEPIACGRRAMRAGRLEQGQHVLVIGGGSMGMAAVWWARRMGAGAVSVATRTPARHDTLRAIGADHALATAALDEAALAAALPSPPDLVVEAVGKPGALMLAAGLAATGGTVVSLGMCMAPDPVLPIMAAFRDVSLHFPVGYGEEDFIATIRAFDADAIRPEIMVSEVAPLSALPALIEEMRGSHAHHKVQVCPH